MSYLPIGQTHTDEEFDALAKAKGDALRAIAAEQGIPLEQVRLTDAQNKAINAKAKAAFKAKTEGGGDNTLLYVGYLGAATAVALLLFGRK
jgi:hypothetical protein